MSKSTGTNSSWTLVQFIVLRGHDPANHLGRCSSAQSWYQTSVTSRRKLNVQLYLGHTRCIPSATATIKTTFQDELEKLCTRNNTWKWSTLLLIILLNTSCLQTLQAIIISLLSRENPLFGVKAQEFYSRVAFPLLVMALMYAVFLYVTVGTTIKRWSSLLYTCCLV